MTAAERAAEERDVQCAMLLCERLAQLRREVALLTADCAQLEDSSEHDASKGHTKAQLARSVEVLETAGLDAVKTSGVRCAQRRKSLNQALPHSALSLSQKKKSVSFRTLNASKDTLLFDER